jgi:hypothetical protein
MGLTCGNSFLNSYLIFQKQKICDHSKFNFECYYYYYYYIHKIKKNYKLKKIHLESHHNDNWRFLVFIEKKLFYKELLVPFFFFLIFNSLLLIERKKETKKGLAYFK